MGRSQTRRPAESGEKDCSPPAPKWSKGGLPARWVPGPTFEPLAKIDFPRSLKDTASVAETSDIDEVHVRELGMVA